MLDEVGPIISSSWDVAEVYERFADRVRHLIPFDRIDITFADPQAGSVTHAYWTGIEIPGRSSGDVYPLDGTITKEVYEALGDKSGRSVWEDMMYLEAKKLVEQYENQ